MEKSLERANYRVTFLILVVGVSAYSLLQSLVIPALSSIQTSMHTSQNTVTWVVTAYLLSASIFTPILGRIGDMVGKERMFMVALLALAAGSRPLHWSLDRGSRHSGRRRWRDAPGLRHHP